MLEPLVKLPIIGFGKSLKTGMVNAPFLKYAMVDQKYFVINIKKKALDYRASN